MDTLVATQQYVNEMTRLAGPGMKVLLMDKETTSIVSCAFAQSEMMAKEVYLFERIDTGADREPLKFLKCIVFVRPTLENVQLLSEELRNPRYGQYYLYFSNIISKADLKIMAECDEYESVKEVNEFYMDSIPLASHLCVNTILNCYESNFNLSVQHFRRCIQTLTALSLQFKKKPTIRYQKSSKDAVKLSEELMKMTVREDKLFETCKSDTVIVIIDRSQDPVSPLLNQWTYEAMVHEVIGMTNNRVTMQNPPEDGLKNIVLSEQHDDFYATNRYLNFGEIGQNIKQLMNDYQEKAQTHQQLESITDMKRFVDQYPQFKKITGTVSKHVQLVGELSKIVSQQNLLEISELEQSIAAGVDHAQCYEKLKKLLLHEKTTDLNALRLVMLYALRWETSSSSVLPSLINMLKQRKMNQRNIEAINTLLRYSGIKRRQNDLFGNQSAAGLTKRFIKGLKGVENVYTQHEPYISQIIEDLIRGKLNETVFGASDPSSLLTRYDNVIIFIIGGITLEESAYVHSFNQKRIANPGIPKILLSSTGVHNTKSFVEQIVNLTPEYGNVANFATVA